MSDVNKPMIINGKTQINQKDYIEIKAAEVLRFLNLYSRKKWDQGLRNTRQLMPQFDIISHNCKISMEDTKAAMYYLEDKGEIIRDVSQRYLRWVWEKVVDQRKKEMNHIESKTNTDQQPEQVKEEKPVVKKEKTSFDPLTIIDKMKLEILKIIMFVIAVIVFYISTYFTFIWFQTMFDPFKSLLLSFAIVGTSVTSFEMMILFKKDKSYMGAVLFGLLWLGVVTFSITTGLSGQLNSEIEKKIAYEENNIVDDSKLLLYQNYEDQIKQHKIDINNLRNDIVILQKRYTKLNYDTTSDIDLGDITDYKIRIKNNQITEIRKEITTIEKEKENMLKEGNVKVQVTKKVDFFTWMEKTLNISSDKLRFVLYLILAVFVDVICPVNFSIVMFYKRKEYK